MHNTSPTQKWLGPYEIIKAIGSYFYGLEVTEGARWHHVVDTTLLEPFRRRAELQDMKEDKEVIWEVKEIVNLRRVKAVAQYRVWWTGYGEL